MTGAEAKEQRLSLGVSQIQVAKEVGISDISLRFFENGARKLRDEHEEKLVSVLNSYKNKKV